MVPGFCSSIQLTWNKAIAMKKFELTDDEIALILSRRQETAALEARIQQRFDQLERKLEEALKAVNSAYVRTGEHLDEEVLKAVDDVSVKKDEFLSVENVCELLGISRSQFWRLRKAGKFKKPAIEYPPRWKRSDIEKPT
jgi:predicted DNA-binding transcriptional regulator AlpA